MLPAVEAIVEFGTKDDCGCCDGEGLGGWNFWTHGGSSPSPSRRGVSSGDSEGGVVPPAVVGTPSVLWATLGGRERFADRGVPVAMGARGGRAGATGVWRAVEEERR